MIHNRPLIPFNFQTEHLNAACFCYGTRNNNFTAHIQKYQEIRILYHPPQNKSNERQRIRITKANIFI